MATSPPTTTLAELAAATVALHAAAAAAARADLGGAQTALAAARLQQTADTAALAATQKALAGLRARLATAEVPDADALLEEIALAQVEERRQGALLLDDADAVAGAQARAAAAAAWLGALDRRAAAAAAAMPAAEAAQERRERWKAAALAAPLDTLPVDAADVRGGVDFADAEQRVVDELPQALRDARDQGWAVEGERLAGAVEAERHAWELLETEVGAASPAALARALAVADDRLRRWAEQAAQRYARARAQVAAVLQGDTLLTQAERDALAANATAGAAAAALRTTREAAREAVLVARAALDDAVLTARAADPTDLDVSDLVATEQGVLDGKEDALGTAEGNYPKAQREAYGTWSGDVPGGVWKKVAGLEEAAATLDELSFEDGQDLVDADEQAEAALVGALWDAELQALRVGFLESQAALGGVLLEQTRAARPARLPAALRGDA